VGAENTPYGKQPLPLRATHEGMLAGIWDIENKRNDWIFDEFTRFLFIKLNEDAKPSGGFTTAKLKSYCEQNKHMGDKAPRTSSIICSMT
jgi:hypothetical protein